MVEEIMLINSVQDKRLILSMYKKNSAYFILNTCNWSQVNLTDVTNQYYAQKGVTLVNKIYNERSVQIKGWIVADAQEQMTARKKWLNTFINPTQELELQYNEYMLKFYPNKSITWSQKYSDNNDRICAFQIDGTAYDPMFRYQSLLSAESVEQDTSQGLFFPTYLYPGKRVVFGTTETGEKETFVLTNDGDIETGLIIKAVCTEYDGVGIWFNLNGFYFYFDGTIQVGATLEINSNVGYRSVQVDGDLRLNEVRGSSVWPILNTGENAFEWGSLGGGAYDLYLFYEPLFFEVEDV